MAPCPDLKPLPTPNSSLDWAAAGFGMVSAATLSGCMGFRLASCLVLSDFKISAGPLSGFMGFQNWRMAPCPDLKPLPTPKSSLDSAAAGFSMVSAGPLSSFMGLSKLTDGPLSRSQTPPNAQQLLGLSCRGL